MMTTTLCPHHSKGNLRSKMPDAGLELAYIREYLAARHHSLRGLLRLPSAQARRLRIEANLYATARLSELESRARMVDYLQK